MKQRMNLNLLGLSDLSNLLVSKKAGKGISQVKWQAYLVGFCSLFSRPLLEYFDLTLGSRQHFSVIGDNVDHRFMPFGLDHPYLSWISPGNWRAVLMVVASKSWRICFYYGKVVCLQVELIF